MQPEVLFKPIDRQYLDDFRSWVAVKEFKDLILAEPPTRAQQMLWFENLDKRSDYLISGIMVSGRWVGACGLKKIDHDLRSAEYFGFIYPDDLRGAGIGWSMFGWCRQRGIELGLSKLDLVVARDNHRARQAYLRWGFSEVNASDQETVVMECSI